jgi:glycosyltransferase involved in cell wall biosynthesis
VSRNSNGRVLLIAPQAPPYGGMALQARLLRSLMERDGLEVAFLPSNLPLPGPWRFVDRIRGVRAVARLAYFCAALWKAVDQAGTVHILAASWLYFFLVVTPSVVLSRVRGKRIVLNYRGGEADRFFRLFGSMVRPILRLAHVVTAPSPFLLEIIERRLGITGQIVPNIVDHSVFRFRERPFLQPKMLVTRHLENLYGVDTVIRAFAEVQRRYPEASLRIAGSGSQRADLEKLVGDLHLRNVEFLGYIVAGDLPAIYDQCDILLNASRADNFPGSLVEAAASGLAIVSSNAGGIPHIFEDGKSALLAATEDFRGLAAAVLRVLDDAHLACRLRRAALEQCRRYEWINVRRELYPILGVEAVGRESCTVG